MAKPRIFISSTYYDLKHVRAELERFIRDQGFEPILNEYGHIAYGSTEKLEEYCYKEISNCDILVSIIGGRYGSDARQGEHSISNHELKTALESGKQVYIFIESAVQTEYRTYILNKGLDITYGAVDNIKVYKFLDEIYKLTTNNQIKGFESTTEITSWLKEQWAGLFQRLLAENSRRKEFDMLEQINSTSRTLANLVSYLTSQKEQGDKTILNILLSDHPIFDKIQKALEIKFRVIFDNIEEMEKLLSAVGYHRAPVQYEDVLFDNNEQPEGDAFNLNYENAKKNKIIVINENIFDQEGKLKIPNNMTQSDMKVYSGENIPF